MTDRYRKKPVEVRAWKISFDGQEPDWVRKAFDGGRVDWCPAGEGIYINTLEGRMKANIGDMLIEGVKGELYGCRADIFAATYEPVAQQEAPEGTITLEQAASHARICSKLAEQYKSDPVLFAALTDAAAIICDLMRCRLQAEAADFKADAERYRWVRAEAYLCPDSVERDKIAYTIEVPTGVATEAIAALRERLEVSNG